MAIAAAKTGFVALVTCSACAVTGKPFLLHRRNVSAGGLTNAPIIHQFSILKASFMRDDGATPRKPRPDYEI